MSQPMNATANTGAVAHPAFLATAPVHPPAQAATPPEPTANRDAVRATWRPAAAFEPIAALGHLFAPDRSEKPTATAKDTDFTRRAKALFSRLDSDDNGFLSNRELQRALHDGSISGDDAAVVDALLENNTKIEDLSDDEWGPETKGTTLADLDVFEHLSADSHLRGKTEGAYNACSNQIASASRTLYPRGLASISADAVHQRRIGDCYFMAALASLAQQHPQRIQDMIRANQDGTFTVTFPGKSPVTIDRPTDAEVGIGAHGGSDGLWVTVMEKAYARSRSSSTDYTVLDGGSTSEGIQYLTGHDDTNWGTTWHGNDAIRDRIKETLADGRLVTANIRPSDFWGDDDTREGMPTKHVYTVIGVDDATGDIIVRNPWGSGGPNDDGIHRFSSDKFGSLFHSVSFEDPS